MDGPRFDNPTACSGRPRPPIPFTAFCAARRPSATRPAATASGYRVMGHPGRRAATATGASRYRRKLARERTEEGQPEVGWPSAWTCASSGSGFGGSIAAWRLAELYRAAGVDPARILVLERGRRFKHTDFRQSMDVDHLSEVYNLIQSTGGTGAQVVTANAVGGGSNLYLAASLRAPRETFERRDRHPGDGPDRRMWPKAISRKPLDPYYRARSAALRVRRPSWKEVSKSGGLWAATLDAAGHTCDRVPLAIDFGALRRRQVVPHRLHLRREEHGHHQLPGVGRARRRAGAPQPPGRARPPLAGQRDRLPLRGDRVGDGQRGREPHAPAGRAARRSSARC